MDAVRFFVTYIIWRQELQSHARVFLLCRPNRARPSPQQSSRARIALPRHLLRSASGFLACSNQRLACPLRPQPQRTSYCPKFLIRSANEITTCSTSQRRSLKSTSVRDGQTLLPLIKQGSRCRTRRFSRLPGLLSTYTLFPALSLLIPSLPLHSCGHFMSAIMGDYVAGFLGSSEGCNWNMNAFDVSHSIHYYVVCAS